MEKTITGISRFFDTMFIGLTASYVMQKYLFGGAVFLFLTKLGGHVHGSQLYALIACLVLFPFAMFFYDSTVGLILGGIVLYLPIPLVLIFSAIKVMFLFCISMFIAPLGMLLLIIMKVKENHSIQ